MAKYHIITFGCQMNKSDSERIRSIFEQLNYSEVSTAEEADVVVINSCSVRQHAIDRIWGLVKKFNQMKKTQDLKTVLTGCLIDADKKRFIDLFDYVFNINDLYQLRNFLANDNSDIEKDYFRIKPAYKNDFHAYVPIMTGCNNFCSYCIVPYTRGREKSRPVKDVLLEVQNLIDAGYKEVHLLGQNVNSYLPKDLDSFSKENPYSHNFAKLLWEVNQITGEFRIHFTSAHPKDMVDEVIKALALPKQVNYLHLALQSGDDEILKAMNRKYSAADYIKIIDKIRKVNPTIALATDLIVGFPGESETQFQNTLEAYKKIRFDISYTAVYSERKGTASAELEDDVPIEEKKIRWRKVQALMKKITLEDNKRFKDKEVEVLIDTVSDGWVEGNSREMKRVRIMNNDYELGSLVNVTVYEPQLWILLAK